MYNKPSITLYFFRLGNSSGGAERMVIRLANELDVRGYEVHLVSWDEDDAVSFYSINDNVKWHRLGFKGGVIDKIRRTLALRRVLLSSDSECFIGFVMSADKTVYAANIMAGVPIIACERNSPEMYSIKFGKFIRNSIFSLLRMSRIITVQFEEYRDGYPEYLRKKIVSISNPVMEVDDYAKPDSPNNGRYTLLCAGRLNFQKRIPLLIEAFGRMADKFPDWDLKIVGEGDARDEIQQKIKDLGLENRIFARGASEEIGKEYASSHLFCLPSEWEGFPNSLSEALAHGLPSIGFKDCDGVRFLIKDGQNGILTDDLDNAFKILMADHVKRVEMGKHAIDDMKQFCAIKIYDQWENIIKGVVK